METTSSLIFASSRCGDFPELHKIREILTSRFGKEFADHAVELHKNNRVNSEVLISYCKRTPFKRISHYSDNFCLVCVDDTKAFTKAPHHGNQNESAETNCFGNWSYFAFGAEACIDQ